MKHDLDNDPFIETAGSNLYSTMLPYFRAGNALAITPALLPAQRTAGYGYVWLYNILRCLIELITAIASG